MHEQSHFCVGNTTQSVINSSDKQIHIIVIKCLHILMYNDVKRLPLYMRTGFGTTTSLYS